MSLKQMRKVIHFIGFGAPSREGEKRSVGGVEIFVYNLIKNMFDKQYKNIVLYAEDSPLKEKFKAENIEIIDFKISSKFAVFQIVKLARLIKKKNVQIIHSHGIRYDFTGAVVSLLTGIPLIITRHVVISDHLIPMWKKIVYILFDQLSMTVAKYVIAISRDAQIKLNKYNFINSNKIVLIYCGIDFKRYAKSSRVKPLSRKDLQIDRTSLLIGTVAQLSSYKSIDRLIRSVPKVVERIPGAVFLIVGEGPEKMYLQNLAKNLGIEKKVRFLGFRKDVFHLVEMMNIFVMTSRREGLPLAILEAMYAGKPIVSTNAGAVSEVVINGKTGILIKSGNPVDIANALMTLLSDSTTTKSYGANARNFVMKEFSIIKSAEQYCWIYDQVLK